MRTSAARYNSVSIALHWLMALGVLALIVIGLSMTHLGLAPMTKFKLYQLHKSIGVTILLAALFRIVWQLTHRPPALPDMPPPERFAAESAHVLLYLFLLGAAAHRLGAGFRLAVQSADNISMASSPGRICLSSPTWPTRRRSKRRSSSSTASWPGP